MFSVYATSEPEAHGTLFTTPSSLRRGPMAAAIFDLDGTLIDAVADIAAGVNRRFEQRGLAPLTDGEAAALLGEGLRTFARRAFNLRGLQVLESEIGDFVTEYIEAPVVHTRLYPGALEALGTLRASGWRLAVCTNKAEVAAQRILEHFGLSGEFDAVCGGDVAPFRKPDPRHLQLTLDRARFDGQPVVMIGDNKVDVSMARGLGVPSVFAAWGYGTPEMAEGATAVAQTLRDLPGLLPVVMQRWQERERSNGSAS